MPGNSDNCICEKFLFHPKYDEISEFADLLRPEFHDILQLDDSVSTKDRVEFLLEAMVWALLEFTFPDEDYSMKIFSDF